MSEFIVSLILICLFVAVGFVWGVSYETDNTRELAVKYGCAEYHQQTGEFQWTEGEEKWWGEKK